MKKLWLFLLFCSAAFGQTASISAHLQDPATGAVGSRTFLRFELKNTGGNQCRVGGTALITPYIKDFSPNSSGVVSGTIYQNSSITCGTQTGNTQWAFTIWRDGKPQPSCFTQITTTPINLDSVTCSNTTPVVSPPTGDGTYCRIDGTNCGFTGNVTFNSHNATGIATATAQNINGILWVGPGNYANIAAAITAAGSNKTIIIVQSNYAGTDCGSFAANVIMFDYRMVGTNICDSTNNTVYNNNDTVVLSGAKHQFVVTGSLNNNGAAVSLWPITNANNVTSNNTIIDGAAPECLMTGTLTGTLPICSGAESAAAIRTTGGTVTNAYGNQGYVSDLAGRTTAITNAVGEIGIGCNGMLGNPKPVNCYGGYFNKQGTQASAKNYAIGVEGNILGRYDGSTLSAFKIDLEDNTATVRSFLRMDGADNSVHIQAVNAQGLYLDDSTTATRIRITSAGVRIGDNSTPTAGLDLNGSFKINPNNTVFYQEGTCSGGNAAFEEFCADPTLHSLLVNENNGGYHPLGTKIVALTADWTCGTAGTVASCVSAQIIGSGGGVPLTFSLPLIAGSYTWECDGVVGQATAATANSWNFLTATNGATNVTASYSMNTAATAMTGGATTDQASTTTTVVIGPTWTLGGTATKMPFHIWGRIEGASASGTVLSLQLVAPTVGDLVTIYRGTSCRLF